MQRIVACLACVCLSLPLTSRADGNVDRSVIEDTYVVAPRQIGEYALVSTANYGDQGQVMAGVTLRYRDPLLPALTADVYVYPSGDSPDLTLTERVFRDSVKTAAERGIYSDVRWGETANVTLRRRDGTDWQGLMIPMQVRHKQGEGASRTYLFHRGIYDYKLRLDVPVAQAGELPAAGDAMVRSVMPMLEVVSTGSCGKRLTIQVLKDGAAMPEGFVDGVAPDGYGLAIREPALHAAGAATDADAKALVSLTEIAMQRQVAQGCTTFPYTPPTDADMVVLKLHYPANFWRSGPSDPKH